MTRILQQLAAISFLLIAAHGTASACPGCKDASDRPGATDGRTASSESDRPTPVRFDTGLYVMLGGTASALIALAIVVAASMRAND